MALDKIEDGHSQMSKFEQDRFEPVPIVDAEEVCQSVEEDEQIVEKVVPIFPQEKVIDMILSQHTLKNAADVLVALSQENLPTEEDHQTVEKADHIYPQEREIDRILSQSEARSKALDNAAGFLIS